MNPGEARGHFGKRLGRLFPHVVIAIPEHRGHQRTGRLRVTPPVIPAEIMCGVVTRSPVRAGLETLDERQDLSLLHSANVATAGLDRVMAREAERRLRAKDNSR
jgi:hypothetical protein